MRIITVTLLLGVRRKNLFVMITKFKNCRQNDAMITPINTTIKKNGKSRKCHINRKRNTANVIESANNLFLRVSILSKYFSHSLQSINYSPNFFVLICIFPFSSRVFSDDNVGASHRINKRLLFTSFFDGYLGVA